MDNSILVVVSDGIASALKDSVVLGALAALGLTVAFAAIVQGVLPLLQVRRQIGGVRRRLSAQRADTAAAYRVLRKLIIESRSGLRPAAFVRRHLEQQSRRLVGRPDPGNPAVRIFRFSEPPTLDLPPRALAGNGLIQTADQVVRVGLLLTFFSLAMALMAAMKGIGAAGADPARFNASLIALLALSAAKFTISAFAIVLSILLRMGAAMAARATLGAYAGLNAQLESTFGVADDQLGSGETAEVVRQVQGLAEQFHRYVTLNERQAQSLAESITRAFADAVRQISVRLDPQITASLQRVYLTEAGSLAATLSAGLSTALAKNMEAGVGRVEAAIRDLTGQGSTGVQAPVVRLNTEMTALRKELRELRDDLTALTRALEHSRPHLVPAGPGSGVPPGASVHGVKGNGAEGNGRLAKVVP